MNLLAVFLHLYKKYGPQRWWPLLSISHYKHHNLLFEISVGAILTQNTAWTNVEKALKCLLEENLMSPQAVAACPTKKLQRCIRSSGYFRQKAKKLKLFSRWLLKECGGNIYKLKKQNTQTLRKKLLAQWGIGEETADSIILYALQKPIFVIDTYTKRLCQQEFGIKFITYQEYQQYFATHFFNHLNSFKNLLPKMYHSKTKLLNEFHALIVKWGKENKKIGPRYVTRKPEKYQSVA